MNENINMREVNKNKTKKSRNKETCASNLVQVKKKREGEGKRKGDDMNETLIPFTDMDELYNSTDAELTAFLKERGFKIDGGRDKQLDQIRAIFDKDTEGVAGNKQQRIDRSKDQFSEQESELMTALENKTIVELKVYCKEYKLPVYGNKGMLCDRVIGNMNIDNSVKIVKQYREKKMKDRNNAYQWR